MPDDGDSHLLEGSMWGPYYKRRRQWFLVAVPGLLLLVAVNVTRLDGGLGELLALAAGIAVLTLIVVTVLVVRMKRRTARLAPADAQFVSSAILLPATVVGDEPPWTTARTEGSPSQLGNEGVLWVDGDGLHWSSAERHSQLHFHLAARDVQAMSLVRLWLRSYGLGISTFRGHRVGFVLPKPKPAVVTACRAAGLPLP